VEATRRVHANGQVVYFLLNHNDMAEVVDLPVGRFTELLSGNEIEGRVEINARDVVVLQTNGDAKRGNS